MTLFLCGDVMTGRGLDQILPHPSNPLLHEEDIHDARDYVRLAEQRNGAIPRGVSYSYVWGDALGELARAAPDLRIVNLETAVTVSDEWAPHKEVHYRMHPTNIEVLTVAGINACALANNHVLDWGEQGLLETLATLRRAGIQTAGAGQNFEETQRPAVLPIPGWGGERRLLLFSLGMENAGVPSSWLGGASRAGVDYLADFSRHCLRSIASRIARARQEHDFVVASIHWGPNWGYEISEEQKRFAQALIDEAGIDLVHGHSSHHIRGIQIHAGKLILHGCGDFLTDYEGIHGHEEFRGDLVLMFFPIISLETRKLLSLRLVPMQQRRFQLRRVSLGDSKLIRELLIRDSTVPGFHFVLNADGAIRLVPR